MLQDEAIYLDVERGMKAGKNDLKKFGKMSRDEIINEILNKGQFQMSDLERDDKLESVKQEIANWISSQCINRETQNQFPSSMIVRGMNEINCKVVLNKAAKQQGLTIIEALKAVLPIERAPMHVKITFLNSEQSETFLKMLAEGHNEAHKVDMERQSDAGVEAFLTIEKFLYKVIQDTLKKDKNTFAQVAVEI